MNTDNGDTEMAKKSNAAQEERAMRDRMNGIVRNDAGEMIMRNNKWTVRGLDQFFIADGVWKA